MNELKVGLVLSGGGAKGAYQVGVVKALIEMGGQVDAIAGASIGALNGAILASAPSLAEGVVRMENLWLTLAKNPPLSMRISPYLILLLAGGLRLKGLSRMIAILVAAKFILNRLTDVSPDSIQRHLEKMTKWLNAGLLSEHPIKKLLDQYLDLDGLSKGLPLYVSVFRSQDPLAEVICCAFAEIGLINTPNSEFLHVQSLPTEQQKNALLASAALPLIFSAKKLGNNWYTDGGQGGWQEVQGNTPITPLIENGYNKIIVTHLSEGSLWNRHNFPETTILEIRPQNETPFILNFKSVIPLMEQGYRDTLHCIKRVKDSIIAVQRLDESDRIREQQEPSLNNTGKTMNASMARLNSGIGN